MSDFASAAMVRVVVASMRRFHMDVPPLPPAPGARVALDFKRELVASAVRQGGLACLIELGQGVHQDAADPSYRALAGASGGPDLLARWCRLERYIHSRHRIDVVCAAPGQAELVHRARTGKGGPAAAEDLLVYGFILAFMQAIGLAGITVQAQDVRVYPAPDESQLRRLATLNATGRVRLRWREPDRAPGVAPDSIALEAVCAELPWSPLAKECARLCLHDLLRPVSGAEMARHGGLSLRSLQRALTGEGLSCSAIRSEARLRAAGWRLLNATQSLSEIGFLCGYADQAHLTRDFTLRVGMPPARYRSDFGGRS